MVVRKFRWKPLETEVNSALRVIKHAYMQRWFVQLWVSMCPFVFRRKEAWTVGVSGFVHCFAYFHFG